MPEVAVYAPGTVSWVDLQSKDLEKSKAFYSKLFGWQPNTIPDPQAGGYTWFLQDGKQVGALGGTQSPDQPTSWSIYFATEDADKTAEAVKAAGGKVIAEPFDVMGAGGMAGASGGRWKVAGGGASTTSGARGTPATPLLVSISVSIMISCWPMVIGTPAICATNTLQSERYSVDPSRLKL